jgi:hypothetical protein
MPKMILTPQQKEAFNFNLVSETQPKINIQTYLYVLKSSCECISPKKGEVTKLVSKLFHVLT